MPDPDHIRGFVNILRIEVRNIAIISGLIQILIC